MIDGIREYYGVIVQATPEHIEAFRSALKAERRDALSAESVGRKFISQLEAPERRLFFKMFCEPPQAQDLGALLQLSTPAALESFVHDVRHDPDRREELALLSVQNADRFVGNLSSVEQADLHSHLRKWWMNRKGQQVDASEYDPQVA